MKTEIGLGGVLMPKTEQGGFEIDYDASLLLGDSAHQAQIVVDENENRWVMKANDVTFNKAQNELTMLERFQREGVPTLPFREHRPFIVKTNDDVDPSAVVYLPFVSGLQPLTRIDWEVHVGTDAYDKRKQDLASCLGLAAKMHKRGFVHGDFQVKNLGVLRTGKLIAFDLENSYEFGTQSTELSTQDKSNDLVSLFKSVRLNGLFADTNPVIAKSEVSEILFGYCEKMKLSDESIEVVELAERQIFEWLDHPERIARALSRFVITKA